MKVSVIDLGFSSLKMVAYEIKEDDSLALYEHKSIHAMLGEGLNETGFLANEPIRRTILGLKLFKDIIAQESIKQVLPIATSAVREAANREAFMKQVRQETGFRFRILSGKEEALYSFSGARRINRLDDVLFLDIGGGSLEMVRYEKNKVKRILSLPLGAYRLTQLYSDKHGNFSGKDYSKMQHRIRSLLPSGDYLDINHDTLLLGVGGTIRALAKYDQYLKRYPFLKLHNYFLKRNDAESINEFLKESDWRDVGEMDIIGNDRAKTLVAGSCVVTTLMKKLDFTKLVVSTHGLRDGVLAAYLENPISYHKNREPSSRLIRSNLKGRTLEFSRNLLNALILHDLIDRKDLELISYGVDLMSTDHESYSPESTFYFIMGSDSKFTHRDQLLVALSVVRTMKPSAEEWFYERYKHMLKPKSKGTAKVFSTIFQLSHLIENLEYKVRAQIKDDKSLKLKMLVSGERVSIPETMLMKYVSELGKALDLEASYSIVQEKSSVVPPTREDGWRVTN